MSTGGRPRMSSKRALYRSGLRAQRADAERQASHRLRRSHRRHRAHLGRDRRGQGSGGGGAARGVPATRAALRQGELRRAAPGAPGERAVRLRARSLHGCHAIQARQVRSRPTRARSSSTRWARCRCPSRPSSSRSFKIGSSHGWAAARTSGWTSVCSPPPTRTWPSWWPEGVPRGSLLSAERDQSPRARLALSRARRSPCSPSGFSSTTPRSMAGRCGGCPRPPWSAS